jgi:excisionase family DNA binding protein
METSTEQELLTTKEAAELLRVSSATISNMLRSGVIRGTKVGIGGKSSPWRIYKEDVMKYVERGTEKSSIKVSI